MDKKTLRKKYFALRKQVSNSAIEEMSLEIANKSLELPIWGKTNYHIYLPISEKKEVNTEYLLHILQGKDKSVVISKANFETMKMTHFLLQENTVLETSAYGITEPKDGFEVSPSQIEVVFVPLLAYDTFGNRVGYGKGFYDRFLAECETTTQFVGLSFFPPEEKILHENIDIPLNYCITPEKIFMF
ncbi:5-formyltetrahydrofolate cyclo-ligase [Jejudonia soesokkakensis]|uniref:5-formyltetrahydrofolate cyclo-ligase n=1 Tax=Jejudonia soesokkakensis TaxID=1323432 RepID=A0ABW2MRJ7_9FLAO